MRQTEAKWAERIRQWRASGQTAEEFTAGQGFKASTLRFWASRLRTKAAAVATPAAAPVDAARVPLVAVRRVGGRARPPEASELAATAETSSATMVIAIGGARIEVRSGFDRALLGAVLDALGGAR